MRRSLLLALVALHVVEVRARLLVLEAALPLLLLLVAARVDDHAEQLVVDERTRGSLDQLLLFRLHYASGPLYSLEVLHAFLLPQDEGRVLRLVGNRGLLLFLGLVERGVQLV